MLVLTRRAGEKIFIGKDKEICITVLGNKSGSNVRIGIEADKDVPIWREEILDTNKISKLTEE